MARLERYRPDDPYAFTHGNAIQHLFAQLHPDLDKEDLAYVEKVVMDAIRDEISDRAEPRKREDY